jgi:hypothetical protein
MAGYVAVSRYCRTRRVWTHPVEVLHRKQHGVSVPVRIIRRGHGVAGTCRAACAGHRDVAYSSKRVPGKGNVAVRAASPVTRSPPPAAPAPRRIQHDKLPGQGRRLHDHGPPGDVGCCTCRLELASLPGPRLGSRVPWPLSLSAALSTARLHGRCQCGSLSANRPRRHLQ